MYYIKQEPNKPRKGIVFKKGIMMRVGYLSQNTKGVYMMLNLENGLKKRFRMYLNGKTYEEAKIELLENLNKQLDPAFQ